MKYTYTKRISIKAKEIALCNRTHRNRNKIAEEYKRLREPYLITMGLMKHALEIGAEIDPKEISEYREETRNKIRESMKKVYEVVNK